MLEISKFFPENISNLISQNLIDNNLEEIHIRVNKPIILKFITKEVVIPYNVSNEDTIRILQIACDNSIYAYQKQICKRIYHNKRWT